MDILWLVKRKYLKVFLFLTQTKERKKIRKIYATFRGDKHRQTDKHEKAEEKIIKDEMKNDKLVCLTRTAKKRGA